MNTYFISSTLFYDPAFVFAGYFLTLSIAFIRRLYNFSTVVYFITKPMCFQRNILPWPIAFIISHDLIDGSMFYDPAYGFADNFDPCNIHGVNLVYLIKNNKDCMLCSVYYFSLLIFFYIMTVTRFVIQHVTYRIYCNCLELNALQNCRPTTVWILHDDLKVIAN